MVKFLQNVPGVGKHFIHYNKVIRSLSVCVYQRISLTAELIWYSFTAFLVTADFNIACNENMTLVLNKVNIEWLVL